jgi:hypothetical protein
MTASTSAIVQQTIPALADALGELARTPGRGESWVDGILRTLEQDNPATSERLRRRIGFAQRLTELVPVNVQEHASMTLGLLFHELISDGAGSTRRSAAAKGWTAYLLANLDWLISAFQVAEAVRSKDWANDVEPGAQIARTTVAFDARTIELHGRPLAVLEECAEDARSEFVSQITDVLRTEQGQELCDHHFRRRHEGYRLQPNDIKQALRTLRQVAPRKNAEPDPAAAPMRWAAPPGKQKERGRSPVRLMGARPAPASTDAFERRRQALRAANSGEAAPTVEEETAPPAPAPEPPERATPAPASRPAARTRRAVEPDEQLPDNIRSIRPADRYNLDDLAEQLAELRARLDELQGDADHRRVLEELAPRLEQFESRIADLERVIVRWLSEPPQEQAA